MSTSNQKKVLVTGGAGFIGSTVASALLDSGITPILLDNLSAGRREFTVGRIFYEGDVGDRSLLDRISKEQGKIAGAIHCAAKIIVPESVAHPEDYYRENVSKSIQLFSGLRDNGVNSIVFSSSASVYRSANGSMVNEESALDPQSPYARTKSMMEWVLRDFCDAYNLRGIALRYFNPIGADPAMRSGPYVSAPTHILGRLLGVASGKIPHFEITGTNWPTRDGSGIRDYIHVWDLARAHVAAIKKLDQVFTSHSSPGLDSRNFRIINLGTGSGVTVRELVSAFEEVIGRSIEKRDAPARPGDVAGSYANCDKALSLLGWTAESSTQSGIRDALKWSHHWDNFSG